MGFRFRRRVRILPGVYLNISRNGVSTTIGPRGASLNIGKQGVFLNTGIPGTGIYRRDRLFGGKGTADGQGDQPTPAAPLQATEIQSSDIITADGLKGVLEEILRAYNDRLELKAELTEKEQELLALNGKIGRKENTFFGKLFTSDASLEQLKQEEAELDAYLQDLRQQLDDAPADINLYMDDDVSGRYAKVVEAFRVMNTSEKIWDVTAEAVHGQGGNSGIGRAVNRQEVKFDTVELDYIRCNFPALHFKNANGAQLYIYPAFILVLDTDNSMSLVDLRELRPGFAQHFFVTDPEDAPADAEVAERTWQNVNKDGSRDRRFSYNPERWILRLGAFHLQSASGINERYFISSYAKASAFAGAFLDYFSCIIDPSSLAPGEQMPSAMVTREVFDHIMESAKAICAFFKKMEDNRKLMLHVFRSVEMGTIGADSSNEVAAGRQKLEVLILHDLMRCFMLFREMGDLRSREALAFLAVVLIRHGTTNIDYAQHHKMYGEGLISSYLSIYETIRNELDKEVADEQLFKLTAVLNAFDRNLVEEFLTMMYRFASMVVKADGKVSPEEEKALARIVKPEALPPGAVIVPVVTPAREQPPTAKAAKENEKEDVAQETTDPMEELMALTGLPEVKTSIRTLTNFIRVQQAREQQGLKAQQVSYHVVFTGNPGTGKTTVARLLAAVYQSLGVLKKGHLVETDRSGLIAEYAGQTAVKVNKVVDSALDGILFIDEAYALVGEGQDSFGKEAVATLIKRMEDNRDRLIVILAGYSVEMMQFIESNPGFKSRFNRYIDFRDFTPEEMLDIFRGMCARTDYLLEEAAQQQLLAMFTTAYTGRDRHFGNGRYVRNIFEKAMEHQANRLSGVAALTPELLRTITAADIAPAG